MEHLSEKDRYMLIDILADIRDAKKFRDSVLKAKRQLDEWDLIDLFYLKIPEGRFSKTWLNAVKEAFNKAPTCFEIVDEFLMLHSNVKYVKNEGFFQSFTERWHKIPDYVVLRKIDDLLGRFATFRRGQKIMSLLKAELLVEPEYIRAHIKKGENC